MDGSQFYHQLTTVNPTLIDKRRHEYRNGMSGQTVKAMNSQMMNNITTPICVDKHPTLTFDHTPESYQYESSSANFSFSGSRTPSSTVSASTISSCSSRRESLANNEQIYTLISASSPSPMARLYEESCSNQMSSYLSKAGDQSTFDDHSFMAQDGRSEYSLEDFQMIQGPNDSLQPANFLGADTQFGASNAIPPDQYIATFCATRAATFQFEDPDPTPAASQYDSQAENITPTSPLSRSWVDMSTSLPPPLLSASETDMPRDTRSRPRDRNVAYNSRVSKTSAKIKNTRVIRAANIEIDFCDGTDEPKVIKKHKCTKGCTDGFGRPEHAKRHELKHRPATKLPCPFQHCEKSINNRGDNLKAHLVKTHWQPTEKAHNPKTNGRISMKEVYERHVSGVDRQGWIEHYKEKYADPDELWRRIRDDDKLRWGRFLDGTMTIHDPPFSQHGKPLKSAKPSRLWTLIGWTIEEAQNVLVTTVAPEWQGPPRTTLWQLDPRRLALEEGSLSLADHVHLGVDMLKTREMNLDHLDLRWKAFRAGEMSDKDKERYGVQGFGKPRSRQMKL